MPSDKSTGSSGIHKVQDRLKVMQSASPSPGKVGWSREDEIIGLLATVTESMATACDNRARQFTDISERISTIEANVKDIRHDISSLCKIVRDGNGQPSMVQRLANAEAQIAQHKSDIGKVEGHANAIIAAKALSKTQVIAGLSGMIITALLSSLALIATLMKG